MSNNPEPKSNLLLWPEDLLHLQRRERWERRERIKHSPGANVVRSGDGNGNRAMAMWGLGADLRPYSPA